MSERYKRVVIEWEQVSSVAKEEGVSPTAIRGTIHSTFRYRHPKVWAALVNLHAGDKPFLWELRAYERWRVIPKERLTEAWSRFSAEQLRMAWANRYAP